MIREQFLFKTTDYVIGVYRKYKIPIIKRDDRVKFIRSGLVSFRLHVGMNVTSCLVAK